jgi:hypothetical protein
MNNELVISLQGFSGTDGAIGAGLLKTWKSEAPNSKQQAPNR